MIWREKEECDLVRKRIRISKTYVLMFENKKQTHQTTRGLIQEQERRFLEQPDGRLDDNERVREKVVSYSPISQPMHSTLTQYQSKDADAVRH